MEKLIIIIIIHHNILIIFSVRISFTSAYVVMVLHFWLVDFVLCYIICMLGTYEDDWQPKIVLNYNFYEIKSGGFVSKSMMISIYFVMIRTTVTDPVKLPPAVFHRTQCHVIAGWTEGAEEAKLRITEAIKTGLGTIILYYIFCCSAASSLVTVQSWHLLHLIITVCSICYRNY